MKIPHKTNIFANCATLKCYEKAVGFGLDC